MVCSHVACMAPKLVRAGRHRLVQAALVTFQQTHNFGTCKRLQHSSATIAPPRPRKAQGPDPWTWLEHQNDEVLDHLTTENRYTCDVMRKTLKVQEDLYREMISQVDKRIDKTPPECIRGFWYYSRREGDSNFPIYYRSRTRPELQPQGWEAAEERVILDQNEMPDFYHHFHVSDMKVSPDGRLLGFTLAAHDSSAGVGTLYMRDLGDGAEAGGRWWTTESWSRVAGFEWGGTHVVYTAADDHLGRPSDVYRCELTQGRRGLMAPPVKVFSEADDQFFVSLRRTKDGRFVTISVNSKTCSEVWLLDATQPLGTEGGTGCLQKPPVRFRPRVPNVQYFVDHGEDHFYVVTNAQHGVEYELCRCPTKSTETLSDSVSSLADGGGGTWAGAECVGPSVLQEGAVIEDIDVFRDFLVVYERVHGLPGIRVLDLRRPTFGESGFGQFGEARAWHRVPLPVEAQGGRLQPGLNQDYEAMTVRFAYTSPVVPRVTYKYDMAQRRLVVLEEEPLSTGPSDEGGRYVCKHLLTDGTHGNSVSVPMTLAHREGLALDGSHPVLLMGYGAYGVCMDVGFNPEYHPLLRRGWVLAFAHVRGGGELGRAWHAAGRGEKKVDSIHDYVRCAEWLIERGYAAKGGVAAYGSSAGGLLVAAAANRRPELFGAMVLKVPFLDIMRTMNDPSLPLTIHEYGEWGNPASDAKVSQAMRSYSPYETLPQQCKAYPDTLVLASLADDRVRYWEAAKWVAKAREACPSARFLLRIEANRGHAGHATQSEMMHESAFEWAFLMSTLGQTSDSDGKSSNYPTYMSRRRRKVARGSSFAGVPVLAWPIVPTQ